MGLSTVFQILCGDGHINSYVQLLNTKEINVKITHTDDTIICKFLAPEPVVKVTKLLSLNESIDYIKITKDEQMFVKPKHWPTEIQVNLNT